MKKIHMKKYIRALMLTLRRFSRLAIIWIKNRMIC